jgi:hypothetical protein
MTGDTMCQAIERSGIGDDERHAMSATEPLKIAALSPEIRDTVGLAHHLQDPVEFVENCHHARTLHS